MDQLHYPHIYSSERITQFTSKYADQISLNYDPSQVRCGIINYDELDIAADLLKQGYLVAFPTETVYGLGADALNEISVRNIFQTKKRPLSDPVIVHLSNINQVNQYIDSNISHSWESLAKKFWPGPFTIVLKGDPIKMPTIEILSAGTGNAGFRLPKHELTQKLLALTNIPIAAPSANLFAHVSPTSPVHVFNDFYNQRVHIIDGGRCENGIESTVVKFSGKELQILRLGSLSQKTIENQLRQIQEFDNIIITFKQQIIELKDNNPEDNQFSEEVELKIEELPILSQAYFQKNQILGKTSDSIEAPGQLLKHYSPNLKTFLFEIRDEIMHGTKVVLEKDIIIIDFQGESYQHLKDLEILAFKRLSNQGDTTEAMFNLYETLRWSENQKSAQTLLIHDFKNVDIQANDEHIQTLKDKIYRSAAGQKIVFCKKTNLFYFLSSY